MSQSACVLFTIYERAVVVKRHLECPGASAHSTSRGWRVHLACPSDLTFSFSHLFELTRELSISLDQGGAHSQIDHATVRV